MVRYKRPEPNDRDPIHYLPEPVPVTFGWPISGTYQPRMDGVAIAWQGDRMTGVTLVQLDTGKQRWVETAGVKRIKPLKPGDAAAGEGDDFPGGP